MFLLLQAADYQLRMTNDKIDVPPLRIRVRHPDNE